MVFRGLIIVDIKGDEMGNELSPLPFVEQHNTTNKIVIAVFIL